MSIERRILRMSRQVGVPILTRRQWGSQHRALYFWRRINRPHGLLPNNPSDTLVQHITVTFDSGELVRDFKTDMQTVERIGYERFGSGFSYNFGWDMQTGMIGVGMPVTAKGTHTVNDKKVPGYSYDQNLVALAIGAIGMPGDKPSIVALNHLAELIAVLIWTGALTEDHDYVPHRLFAYKECPTDAVVEAMPYVARQVKRNLRKWRKARTNL